MPKKTIQLGFAKEDITPRLKPDHPLPLAGYFVENRFASGIHDRLYARALAFLPAGSPPVLVLQLDLLCLDAACMNELYRRLGGLGIAKNNLVVFCVHTHSGFGGVVDTRNGVNRELVPLYGAFEQARVDFLADKCRAAASGALENGAERGAAAKIRMNRGTVTGLAANRHAPGKVCDDGLFTVELLREDGKKALLYNLSCHPTVLSGNNRLVSADFAGAAAALFETPQGEPAPRCDLALCINGSAGDMSTRFTRKESGFAECERLGRLVYDAVSALTGDGGLSRGSAEGPGRGGFEALSDVSLAYHTIFLKRAEIPGAAEAEQNLAAAKRRLEETRKTAKNLRIIRTAESFVEGAAMSLLRARHGDEASGGAGRGGGLIPVEAGLLTLNGQKILCSPFELFSTLAVPLKRRTGLEFFGYANALLGYLADTESYEAMDYEALSGDFAKGEGERYMSEVEKIL